MSDKGNEEFCFLGHVLKQKETEAEFLNYSITQVSLCFDGNPKQRDIRDALEEIGQDGSEFYYVVEDDEKDTVKKVRVDLCSPVSYSAFRKIRRG